MPADFPDPIIALALPSFGLQLDNVLDSTATLITTTSLTDVAGLSWSLEANKTYKIEYEMSVVVTGLAGTITVAPAYTGTTSAFFANVALGNSVSSVAALLTTVVSSLIALGGTLPISVSGRIRTTSAGTLTLQAARSAGSTATITGGAALVSEKLP